MLNSFIFIAHGPAWWREISADPDKSKTYPTGPIVSVGKERRLLSDCYNLYADISATSGFNTLSRDISFSEDFVEKHSDKLIFGSDFLCIAPDGHQDGPIMRHLELLRTLRILGENALSLMGE